MLNIMTKESCQEQTNFFINPISFVYFQTRVPSTPSSRVVHYYKAFRNGMLSWFSGIIYLF